MLAAITLTGGDSTDLHDHDRVSGGETARVRERCSETLARNWTSGERDGVEFAYTCPSPQRYRWQWYWDSCYCAIVWRRFDRDRARNELCTLLRAAREDGFIGHTIFWDGPVRAAHRRPPRMGPARARPRGRRPFVAVAARRVGP